ncbi:hypothetical protein AMECASPLE_036405, partial [Ameca splendens]
MQLPSSCMHIGPIQTQNVTLGTSHKQDQADRAKELKMWIKQQEETLQAMYGEGVEILPSPLLLEEMECFGVSDRVPMDVVPDRNHTSPGCSPSRRRRPRPRRKRPPQLQQLRPSSTCPQLLRRSHPRQQQLLRSHARLQRHLLRPNSPLVSAPALDDIVAAEQSPLGRFGWATPTLLQRVHPPWPPRGYVPRSWWVVVQRPLQFSSRRCSLHWVQARLKKMKEDFMKGHCCDFVLHLMDHPEDLNLVHSVLQAEFIAEGWLDAPAPLSAGRPFDPLFVAVRAAQSSKDSEPQPTAVKLHEPQH